MMFIPVNPAARLLLAAIAAALLAGGAYLLATG
jgi:hypothetical protein